ncbi:MAG TPA: threonine--tRNA ligase [Ignavibacteriales bacterium]|nr:threonine--tRNA ligase [Ignavibacteriales bacterium]HOL80615.1 threonine--tRNA ligase [Ignavibacteriales bacterium]HOM64303.1 threonine--tRNA ligase [Ignavibacteriales bacterium]HPD68037.1 threonine--tRNA ligase [Ignavibacteriales bacterium]HPP33051.1 threonine--tRNA ligase [Ignavibacteriales bacterium]
MGNIKITFPDSSIKEYPQGVTAYEVAQSISPKLAEDVLLAVVNDEEKDLSAKLENDCTIKFLKFDDERGKHTYWHSSSHLMAHAIKSLFPEAKFGVGPAIENGFYYDIDIDTKLTEEDLPKIEAKMMELAAKESPFVRKELSKKEALEFFEKIGDNYKVEIISELDETDKPISIYYEGDFVDLCTGPHLPHTGKIKFVKLLSVSGSYWRGDHRNKQLQRIYGITFPKKKMLDDYITFLEEAKKRDHRLLGKQLDLFHTQDDMPGMVFWHPRGWKIYRTLQNFVRSYLDKNGYQEVNTPSVMSKVLWEKSGHWEKYKENMFITESEKREFAIKPMNCPGHIQIFNQGLKSYKDLPLRLAEFGSCVRNEPSGSLHGIMRVRGFVQDDAHIFCTENQIEDEVKKFTDLLKKMYSDFGFNDIIVKFATRPEKRVGSDEVWDKAEAALESACNAANLEYKLNPGEGAFYGPKLEFTLRDSLGRLWQLGTIQVDFNLPVRLGATYVGEDGQKHHPVMLHRAILGSLERFIGILIEHFGGAFPLWLSPVQVVIIPVSEKFTEYANSVYQKLFDAGISVEFDTRSEKVGYKIREWETQKVPYMLVIGEKEQTNNNISVRARKKGDLGSTSLDEFIKMLQQKISNKELEI